MYSFTKRLANGMKMKNNFTENTRLLFFYNYDCFWCGQNGWDALHHILGRVSDSPLNASPIHNLKCHIGNGSLDSFDNRSKLLKKTKRFLEEEGYVLTDKDKEFLEENKQYYV